MKLSCSLCCCCIYIYDKKERKKFYKLCVFCVSKRREPGYSWIAGNYDLFTEFKLKWILHIESDAKVGVGVSGVLCVFIIFCKYICTGT